MCCDWMSGVVVMLCSVVQAAHAMLQSTLQQDSERVTGPLNAATAASNIWGANLSLTPARREERKPWQHATIQRWNEIIFSLFLSPSPSFLYLGILQ